MDTPYKAPESRLVDPNREGSIEGYKKYVIASPDADWPQRCYKCNQKTEHTKPVKLSYVNPWWYLTILIALLITIIVILIVQKKFSIALPMCEKHLLLKKRTRTFQWSAFGMTIIFGLASAALGSPLLIIFACLSFVGVIVAAVASGTVRITKYKDGKLWILGAGKEFVSSLPTHQK